MPTLKRPSPRGDVDFTHLNTKRLRLRRFDIADLIRVVRYRSKPEVARFQSWTAYGADEAMKLIREMKSRNPGTVGCWFQFAIERRADRATGSPPQKPVIGDCGLKVTAADPTHAEIGFTLDSEFQGQGYGAEAVAALVDYCFRKLRLRRITATTDAMNAPSARLLERVGFRREAHFVENTFFKGGWGSECQFALLAREWKARKKKPARPRSKKP